MPARLQVASLRPDPPLRNWDLPLRMYYDETNNIRRLTLSQAGASAPTDRAFTLAGVALKPHQAITGWADLRRELRIQTSALEVKFEHLAPSDYEGALAARKLSGLLAWLVDNDYLIHYSVLDVLYWSVLDIVETLMPDERLFVTPFHLELKNELYVTVCIDPPAFMSLLHGFNYPNVGSGDVGAFLEAVLEFLEQEAPEDRNLAATILKQTLRHAARIPDIELPFLQGNKPGELIDNFSMHFVQPVCHFKNGSHVFDRETYVEKALQNLEIVDGQRRLDYRFADSESEIGVQIADVVAGLLGRQFTYVQQHTLPELLRRKAGYSENQRCTLRLLRALIDRSDAFSDALLHSLLPLDTVFKNNTFLHEQVAPAFLYETELS